MCAVALAPRGSETGLSECGRLRQGAEGHSRGERRGEGANR